MENFMPDPITTLTTATEAVKAHAMTITLAALVPISAGLVIAAGQMVQPSENVPPAVPTVQADAVKEAASTMGISHQSAEHAPPEIPTPQNQSVSPDVETRKMAALEKAQQAKQNSMASEHTGAAQSDRTTGVDMALTKSNSAAQETLTTQQAREHTGPSVGDLFESTLGKRPATNTHKP